MKTSVKLVNKFRCILPATDISLNLFVLITVNLIIGSYILFIEIHDIVYVNYVLCMSKFWCSLAVAAFLLACVLLLLVKICRGAKPTNQLAQNGYGSSHGSWNSASTNATSCWGRRQRKQNGNESGVYIMETRTLQHLPYCEET